MSVPTSVKTIHAGDHTSQRGYARIDALFDNCSTIKAIAGNHEPSAEHVVEFGAPDGSHQARHTARPAHKNAQSLLGSC